MKLIVTIAIAIALIIVGLVAAQRTSSTSPAGAPAADRAPMKAIGSVKDIMLAITIPTSTDVFNAASEPPTDDPGWERVQHQALALAESSNLLMMADRSDNREGWDALAVAQLDAAVVAMKAAQRKDADALSTASDTLYETCDNCHKKFMQRR